MERGSRVASPSVVRSAASATAQQSITNFTQAVSSSQNFATQPGNMQPPVIAPASTASADHAVLTSSCPNVTSYHLERQMSQSPIDVVTPLTAGTDVTFAQASAAPAPVNRSPFANSVTPFASDFACATPAFPGEPLQLLNTPKATNQLPVAPSAFCPLPFPPPPPPAYQDLKSPDSGIGESCLSPDAPKQVKVVCKARETCTILVC